MEHRWGARVWVDVPVRLEAGPRLAAGFIRDASLSGAYIKTTSKLAPCTPVLVELRWGPLDASGPHRIRAHVIRAHVIRIDESGLALEWAEFAPEPVRALIAHANRMHRASAGRGAPPLERPGAPRRITG